MLCTDDPCQEKDELERDMRGEVGCLSRAERIWQVRKGPYIAVIVMRAYEGAMVGNHRYTGGETWPKC